MIYFTSDTHFGHEGILSITGRPRPIGVHDSVIMNNINDTVGKKDTLYILGDFCWHSPEHYLSSINCKNVHLIIGNHDHKKSIKFFKSAYDVKQIKIRHQGKSVKVFMSHYPHAYWPASHHGSLHLYGHVHAAREQTLDRLFPGRRSLDVGVDNAYRILGKFRPFSELEILTILMSRPGHDHVEWYESERRKQGVGND